MVVWIPWWAIFLRRVVRLMPSIFAAEVSWPRVLSRQARMISRSTKVVAVSCSLPLKAGWETSFSATARASSAGGPAVKRLVA